MPSLRFRFTEPDDVAKYGGDWTVYDEDALLRLPTGRLIGFEKATGMSIARMIVLLRDDYVEAKRAATWIARHLAGAPEPFADYDPLVMLIEFGRVPEAEAEVDDRDPLGEGSSMDMEPPA
jgi:hypothetical protein